MILFIEHMSFIVHLKDVINMKKHSKLTHVREESSGDTAFEFFKTVNCIMKTKQRNSVSFNVG